MDADFPLEMLPCIQDFFSQDKHRPPGYNLYPDVFRTGAFAPLQRMRELEKMIGVARESNPKVIYEIGTDKGGGLYHWCKCFPMVTKVIACEIRGTPYRHLFEENFPNIQFLWIEGSSYDAVNVQAVKEFLDRDKIDVLFIDGDKLAFHTDFLIYHPMMASTGVIFMHDVRDDGPRESFEKIQKLGHKAEVILDTTESDEAVARDKRGDPIESAYDYWLRYWKGASCGVGVFRMSQ